METVTLGALQLADTKAALHFLYCSSIMQPFLDNLEAVEPEKNMSCLVVPW